MDSPANVGWMREYNAADPKNGIINHINKLSNELLELQKFTQKVFEHSNLKEKDSQVD